MNQKLDIAIFVTIIIILLASQAPATDVRQDEVTPQMKEHSWRILERLNWLLNEGKLCDVTIIVGDRPFQAHKLVLSAGSPYFEAMFANGNMRESVSTEPITLHDLDAESFEMMKNYIYTGRVTIEDSTVQRQLAGASYLQMTNVKADCCAYMKGKLNVKNCLGIIYIADKYSCADLLQSATVLALDAFEDVVPSHEFLELTLDQLISIISEDSLNVNSEEKVYEAAMRWIKYHDSSDGDRTNYLPTLMQHVRFSQMKAPYLVRVSKDPLIIACKQCLEYVKEAEDYSLLNTSVEHVDESSIKAQLKPRAREQLFAVGGSLNEQSTSSVERYDPKTDKWTEVMSMISSRKELSVATLNNVLYAVGGYTGSAYLSSIECYDPHTEKWSNSVQRLKLEQTTYNRIAALNGISYVIGGLDSSRSVLQSVVKYDPNINEWIKCKNLRQKRTGYAVGVLNDFIYVMGGDIEGRALNTVERYDPAEDEWHDVSPMIEKKYNLATATHDGWLYVVGGIGDGLRLLNSAERYNPKTHWVPTTPMAVHRYGLGLAVANGLIYAVGGYDMKQKTLNTVEVYDPATDIWSKRTPMLKKRGYFGLASMKL